MLVEQSIMQRLCMLRWVFCLVLPSRAKIHWAVVEYPEQTAVFESCSPVSETSSQEPTIKLMLRPIWTQHKSFVVILL